jgi:hypothetical protein
MEWLGGYAHFSGFVDVKNDAPNTRFLRDKLTGYKTDRVHCITLHIYHGGLPLVIGKRILVYERCERYSRFYRKIRVFLWQEEDYFSGFLRIFAVRENWWFGHRRIVVRVPSSIYLLLLQEA